MGAFFLYRVDKKFNLPAVEALFQAKGFTAPAIQTFGSWRLMHYRKQLVPQEPLSACLSGTHLSAVGTFTYKGKGVSGSINEFLQDYIAGRVDYGALLGTYCLLLSQRDAVTLVLDPLNLLHVFYNEGQTVFSSSFAAVLKAGPHKYRANVPALLENALTGYVIGPDTTVNGISVMDNHASCRITAPGITVRPHDQSGLMSETSAKGDFNTCVTEQLATLNAYFGAFRNLVDEAGGVDIGLSGGYDSRLLILMAMKHFSRVVAHSHFHLHPTTDEVVAQLITQELGIPLNRISSAKQPGVMENDEFEQNVENTAAYADGRVFHDYSWLVWFRTRWYREALLKDVHFGMNGLSGELYRNHWNQILPSADTREWLKARVLGQGVYNTLSKMRLGEVMDYMLAKASLALGEPIEKRISHAQMRRYYGELFSVYSASAKICVDNQLAFSLAPYLDYHLRGVSYRALPHLGWAGRFEGEMIRRLNPAVAAITSSYGYPLDQRPPARAMFKILARGMVPYSLQTRAYAWKLMGGRSVSSNYQTIRRNLPLVRRAEEIMRLPQFGIAWDRMVQDEVLTMRVLSLGVMLLKYEDCVVV